MSEKIKILVVEDDIKLSKLIQEYLMSQGFDVNTEIRGDTALERIISENPDLVILDLMLPGLDGLSVLREVRYEYKGKILILTAREDDMDQVAGLEAGADDYVKKPVMPRVLLARVRAVLRRTSMVFQEDQKSPENGENTVLSFGKLEIIKSSRRVKFKNEEIDLSTGEFDLLWHLAKNSGEIISREVLYLELKGYDYDGLDRSMDVAVSRVRKKMGDNPRSPFRIKTVWGKGYLFVPDAWR
jgi:DNA-binding response OmpR family regulator